MLLQAPAHEAPVHADGPGYRALQRWAAALFETPLMAFAPTMLVPLIIMLGA